MPLPFRVEKKKKKKNKIRKQKQQQKQQSKVVFGNQCINKKIFHISLTPGYNYIQLKFISQVQLVDCLNTGNLIVHTIHH